MEEEKEEKKEEEKGGGKVSKFKIAEHSSSNTPTFADESTFSNVYLYHNVPHFPQCASNVYLYHNVPQHGKKHGTKHGTL